LVKGVVAPFALGEGLELPPKNLRQTKEGSRRG
jgi:hypothetical protein